MTIINFDDIIGKKFDVITNNIFCLSHPKNALIIGKTNSVKTNILFNSIAQNSIYEKIYIYTNNLNDKYKWLALGLAILEAIYFVYILLVLDYFMKELTL